MATTQLRKSYEKISSLYGKDTRELYNTGGGRPLASGAPATAAQNPRGVPGAYQSPTGGVVLAQTTLPSYMPRRIAPAPNLSAPSGTAANPSPNPITPLRRASFQTGQYAPGSFGEQNAMANAGLYMAGTFGAQNAAANRTGTVVQPGTVFSQPTTGLPAPAPVRTLSPTTVAAPQTESRNPLTGADNEQMEGTTASINPGVSLGLSRAGATIPRGTDIRRNGIAVLPQSRPSSYDNTARRLFESGLS